VDFLLLQVEEVVFINKDADPRGDALSFSACRESGETEPDCSERELPEIAKKPGM
jgi:hypothetical protein